MSFLSDSKIYDSSGNAILSDSGALAVSDFIELVQAGIISKHQVMKAFGERENVGTTTNGEDVWRGTATTIPTPADAGEQMEVVSTSANDDGNPVGTGIRTLDVHYLDASGNEGSETITMDGTTPVALIETNIRFVQDMHSATVGSNGVAEGDITIYKQGASSTIYSIIETGGNKAIVPHRMVPLGKKLHMRGWHAEEAQGKRGAFRIRSTDMEGVLLPGVFCFKDAVYLSLSTTGELPVFDVIPALSIVKVSIWANVAGGEASCGWWGILVDD